MKNFLENTLVVIVVLLYFLLQILLYPFYWLNTIITGQQDDMADEHSMDSGLKYEVKDYHIPPKKE